MSDTSFDYKEKFEISYEDYFRIRLNGIIETYRELTPLLDKQKALEKLKKLWEKKGIGMIERLLRDSRSITNFEEFKETYMQMMSRDLMDHSTRFAVVEDTPKKFSLKFTKCLWAKTVLEFNAPELGYIICCNPDFGMAKAFHPNIKLIGKKTLMKGDDCCDPTYIWEE